MKEFLIRIRIVPNQKNPSGGRGKRKEKRNPCDRLAVCATEKSHTLRKLTQLSAPSSKVTKRQVDN